MKSPRSVLYLNPSISIDDASKRLAALSFSTEGVRRLCFHDSPDSGLHVMLIEAKGGCAFGSHWHPVDEFIHVVRGALTLSFPGVGSNSIRLVSDGIAWQIVRSGVIHSTVAGPDGAMYLEVKSGPFTARSTVRL